MKLEETENLKLQFVNRIETNTTHINNIQESDAELIEKITEILNIYERHPNFKGKPSFKKWFNYCRRYGHSIFECRQKQQDNQNKPQKHKEPNKSFYQYMKKTKIYQTKLYIVITVQENHFQATQFTQEINHHITQSPYKSITIQTLKANHPSKNGLIIADDTDTVFSNVDKNNKTIRINLKSTKSQINHSINI